MSRSLKQHMRFKELSLKRVYQAAALLLFLAVGSSMLATAPFAKYVTKGGDSSDSATVAAFSVEAAQVTSDPTYNLNSTTTTGDYQFTVSSNSEVAATYNIVVTLTEGEVMDGVTMSLKNDTAGATFEQGTPATTADGVVYTFENAGTFAADSAQTQALTLTFTAQADATSGTYPNIKLEAVVTQVD